MITEKIRKKYNFKGVKKKSGITLIALIVTNIVDDNGNIYEGINNKNADVNNIKQLVSSNTVRCALSNDGKLYAKGRAYMWGDEIRKSNYTIITKDGNEEFNNIDKVFAIRNGYGCIFITKEKEIYWGGLSTYVAIPGIKGDVPTIGQGSKTRYPEKVENEIINSIVDKIKDIKSNFINESGITGKNTLILTNDGKLYTYSNNSNMTGVGATSDFTEIKFDGAVVEQIETLDGLSLAVLSNGEVYGIGKNDYGQLGTGDNIGASTFVRCEELEK